MGWNPIKAVVRAVEKTVSKVADVVSDVGSFIDDKVIQPVIKDPVSAIATVVGAAVGGPVGAGIANTVAGIAQGEKPEEAIKGGITAGAATFIGGEVAKNLGGSTGAVADVGAAPGVEVFPVTTSPVSVTPIQPSGLLGGATGAVVPSAFDTAVNTALGQTAPAGQFGPVGTAGFGTALPPASDVAAGLTSAGFAPGTAANLAGQTAAGVGATNLLGGATAAAPIAAPATLSVQDALRGARLINSLMQQPQQQMPEMESGAYQPTGGVDYSSLLRLLSQQPQVLGLLGTRFQPQPVNLSLLG